MKNMYKYICYSFVILICLLSFNLSAQVGLGKNSDGSLTVGDGAIFDIRSNTSAILIPKVNIINLNTIAPIIEETAAEESLLVYNTNNSTGKGFHYWDGTEWILIGFNVSGGDDWKIIGNSGMVLTDPPAPGDNFLGTIDDNDYIFRTNGVERMRLTYEVATGDARLGVGTDTPDETVDVNGDIEMGGGSIRYDNQGENLYMRPTRNTWYTSVRNESSADDSHFFIGDNAGDDDSALSIDPLTKFVLIGNDGNAPVIGDILHVVDDQRDHTVVRIDNDNSSTAGVMHTSLELWEGPTQNGIFGHKNAEEILEISHGSTTGNMGFYLQNTQLMSITGSTTTVNYDLNVAGALSKGSGTFKIDHPLDPENKYLYHSFVESPDMMNIYNGNITTDENGLATIKLPSYFNALNKEFQYLFTPIGSFSKVMVIDEISKNTFSIKSEQPNVKISWQVTGVRQDPYANKYRVIPEVEKENKDISEVNNNFTNK